MATLDYIIIGIVLVSAIAGVVRGFLKEVCALVTWFLAVWLAWHYGPSLEPYLGGVLRKAPYGLWAGRAIVFIAVLIVGAIIGSIIGYFVRLSLFSATDRLLGFVLGVARGILAMGIVVILAHSLNLNDEAWWKKSKLAPYLEPVASVLRALAPGQV